MSSLEHPWPTTDPRPLVDTGDSAGEWRLGEGHRVAKASANRTTICLDLCRSPGGGGTAASVGWLLSSLLGVLSCNSVLGIEEASLQCDITPCPSDRVSAAGSSAGTVGTLDVGAAGDGAGGMNGAGASAGASSTPASSEVIGDLPVSGSNSEPSNGSSSTPANPGSSDPPAGAGGAAPSDAADSGAPAQPATPALCSSADDACGTCLCDACEDEVAACEGTPGCFEIVACARLNGCVGFACFCGSVGVIACATSGAANGPCVDQTLAAPGSHLPTLASPSAGPASDAALSLANCNGQRCSPPCQN